MAVMAVGHGCVGKSPRIETGNPCHHVHFDKFFGVANPALHDEQGEFFYIVEVARDGGIPPARAR